MILSTPAFILSVSKYQEADAIIKAYTKETGFTTFFVKGLFKSKKNNLKKAYLQPASIVDLVMTKRDKDTMEYIKEVSPAYHYKNLNQDFDKLNISIFLREILLNILREEPGDPKIFEFIINEFKKLDRENFNINFHLLFILKLIIIIGIAPDTHSNGKYFDLKEGIFTDSPESVKLSLNIDQSQLFKSLLGTIFAYDKEIKIGNMQRKQMLETLIKYLELHVSNFKTPKSLTILAGLYS
jgi:DNA repair protein RecO (recombination protein O)